MKQFLIVKKLCEFGFFTKSIDYKVEYRYEIEGNLSLQKLRNLEKPLVSKLPFI